MKEGKKHIEKALVDRGFTGKIELFFWNNDGWYCNCDQMNHFWIGQNANHAIEEIKKDSYSYLIT